MWQRDEQQTAPCYRAGRGAQSAAQDVGGTVAGVTAKVSGAYNFGNDFHKTGVGSFTVTAEAAYAFDFVSVKAKVTGGSAYAFNDKGDYEKAKVTVAPELTLTNNTLIQKFLSCHSLSIIYIC